MISWNPSREAFTIPLFNHPVAWYGILFAFGFFVGFYIFVDIYSRYLTPYPDQETLKRAKVFTERLTFYVLIGTLIGARLGDILFYEHIADYLQNPIRILKTWEGGLSSHGGVAGILIALTLLYVRVKNQISWITIIDLLSIPTAFAAVCIRLGNFINQEILGTPTDLPWAITFLDPIDGSSIVPRHPVQLYEALFYLIVFIGLFSFFRRRLASVKPGLVGGIFFVLVFTFRFLIEYIKEKQSVYVDTSWLLSMGQLLSVPCILFGLFLIFRQRAIWRAT